MFDTIINLVLQPFSWLLLSLYNVFGSYGLAIIAFAFIVKVVLFPFSLKGKRSMIEMNMMSSKTQAIQKRCGNDKERANIEIQKLYAKEKVNPMGGCLWSLLPVLVLLPLYSVIRQPLTHLMGLSPDTITAIANGLDWGNVSVAMGWVKPVAEGAVNAYNSGAYNELFLSSLINPQNLAAVQGFAGEAASKVFAMDFSFLGLNLSQIPNVKFWISGLNWGAIGLFLVPVISALSGLLFSLIMTKTNQMNNQGAAAANGMNSKMMLLMSPVMSLWIGFIMPAGLGIYWIANNLFSMLQEWICGKLLKKDYAQIAIKRAEAELFEKEEEKRLKKEAVERKALAIAEGKKNKKEKSVEKKGDASVSTESRVGMRTYARGRAYDPNRFAPDGPTSYKDPTAIIDEMAVEAALEKKKKNTKYTGKETEVVAEPLALSEEKETEAAENDRHFAERNRVANPDEVALSVDEGEAQDVIADLEFVEIDPEDVTTEGGEAPDEEATKQ